MSDYPWQGRHIQTPWEGPKPGLCEPLPGDAYVRVWLRNGACLDNYVSQLDWTWRDDDWDILSYFLLVPSKGHVGHNRYKGPERRKQPR
jgi:hypothetical protein